MAEERLASLEGMYISHNLQELAIWIDCPIVVANYVADLNDVIAVDGVRCSPEELGKPPLAKTKAFASGASLHQ